MWQLLFDNIGILRAGPTLPKMVGSARGAYIVNSDTTRTFFLRSSVYWYRGQLSLSAMVIDPETQRQTRIGKLVQHWWCIVPQIVVRTRLRSIPWIHDGIKGKLEYFPGLRVPGGTQDYDDYEQEAAVGIASIEARRQSSRLCWFHRDPLPNTPLVPPVKIVAEVPDAYLSEREIHSGWIEVFCRCYRMDFPPDGTDKGPTQAMKRGAHWLQKEVGRDYSPERHETVSP